ncbi:MAG: hypothetical protein H7066_12150 [Cytophagaceae bacterium]|nr:hypothetical protein [Gemmatimonadaceae bacterium]
MPEHTFQCYLTRHMRGLGLEGSGAWVRVSDGLIDLTGIDGGQVRIRLDDIARIRVGFLDSKGRSYETRIWTPGAEKPMRLTPTIATLGAYGHAIRFVTSQMAGHQRQDRIERGYSKFDAIFGPAMMGVLVLAAMGISIFALGNEPWWGRLLAPAIPLLIFGLLLWLGVSRYWPRPIRQLSDLDVQLPPTKAFR